MWIGLLVFLKLKPEIIDEGQSKGLPVMPGHASWWEFRPQLYATDEWQVGHANTLLLSQNACNEIIDPAYQKIRSTARSPFAKALLQAMFPQSPSCWHFLDSTLRTPFLLQLLGRWVQCCCYRPFSKVLSHLSYCSCSVLSLWGENVHCLANFDWVSASSSCLNHLVWRSGSFAATFRSGACKLPPHMQNLQCPRTTTWPTEVAY